jgi:hypothetical protein
MKYVTLAELRVLKKAGAVSDAVIRWNGDVVELDVKLPEGRAQLVATREKNGQPNIRQFRDPDQLRALLSDIGLNVATIDTRNSNPAKIR